MGIYMSYDAYSSIKGGGGISATSSTGSASGGSTSGGSTGSSGSSRRFPAPAQGAPAAVPAEAQAAGKHSTGGSVGIECYEVVMAEPVKGFAMNVAKEKFPIGGGVIIDNSNRYSYENILKLVKQSAPAPCRLTVLSCPTGRMLPGV